MARAESSSLSRTRRIVETVVFVAAVGLVWEVGVRWFGVRTYVLPSVSAVAQGAWTARSQLVEHAFVTVTEVVMGFTAAVAGGCVIGMCICLSSFARRTVYPLLAALQSIPKSALAPLMVVWFGYGVVSKVAMSFLFAFFPVLIATKRGFDGTPAHLAEHFRALQASEWQTFWHLRLPSALPILVDGCLVAMPLAVMGAVIGEFVAAEKGLGSLLLLAAGNAQTELVFATIVVVSLLSLGLNGILEAMGRFVWWRGL